MSSVGTTTIVITGDARQREALHALAAGTCHGPKMPFTVGGLLGWTDGGDDGCWWSSLVCDVDHLTLAASLSHNRDCIGLARALSGRFDALTFHSWFQREDEVEQALATGHCDGAEFYRVRLDGPATFFGDTALRWGGCLVRYHERSPAADIAAQHHADASALLQLASRAPGASGWHAVPQDGHPSLFYRSHGVAERGTAILVDDDEITLLEEVNLCGGYRHRQVLTIDALQAVHPEVCPDVLGVQKQRQEMALRCVQARLQAPCVSPYGDLDEEPLAF